MAAKLLLMYLLGLGTGGYFVHRLDATMVKKTLGGNSLSIRNNVWKAAIERATCQTELYNITAVR